MDSSSVEQVRLAGSVAAHDMSIMGMFMATDTLSKVVIMALLAASVWTWAIIMEKLFRLRRLKKRAFFFEERFWSGGSLETLYDKISKSPGDPMANVFVAGMKEWRNAADKNLLATPAMRGSLQARVERVMQTTSAREMSDIEHGMAVLASVASASPFVGLFGTVWGIMNSFTAIAQQGNTSLATIAPGIAEALFTTALGLVAAIPATLAYNKYATDINRYGERLETFSSDFHTLLSRNLEEHRGG
ncbi:MAG: protein TolQ [Alphaproteobacteria bacterium]|nr:MAG: protein TolQ [Alphaproteobacteria bacterium]